MQLELSEGEFSVRLQNLERHLYDDIEAENWSRLKLYKVPQQALWNEKNPDDYDAPHFQFGRRAHMLVLEEKLFHETYICEPAWSHGGGHLKMVKGKTTKDEGGQNRIEKEVWDIDFKDYQKIDKDEWKQLQDMRTVLLEDPVTSSILNYPDSMREITCMSVMADDTRTKSLFDIVLDLDHAEATAMFGIPSEAGIWIGDYKTARDASPRKFWWAADTYGYFGQASFYFDNYARATGTEPAGFFFFAQDKSNGYTPCTYIVTPDRIKRGRVEYERLLKVKRECKKTGVFPGYAKTALYLGD